MREQLGVGGAEEGAVRRTEVVEPPLAQSGSEDVHVLRGLDGRHVPGELAVPGQAALTERMSDPGQLGDLCRSVRVGVDLEELVGLLGVPADQGRALADAARVHADDVVVAAQRAPEGRLPGGGVVDGGRAGPAGVHDELADPLAAVRGTHAQHRQLDRLPVGIGVVERHPQMGALIALALVPVELLVVEAGELRGVLRLRNRLARRGWRRVGAVITVYGAPRGPRGETSADQHHDRHHGDGHHDPGPAPARRLRRRREGHDAKGRRIPVGTSADRADPVSRGRSGVRPSSTRAPAGAGR